VSTCTVSAQFFVVVTVKVMMDGVPILLLSYQ
jgi:hypothetical protein